MGFSCVILHKYTDWRGSASSHSISISILDRIIRLRYASLYSNVKCRLERILGRTLGASRSQNRMFETLHFQPEPRIISKNFDWVLIRSQEMFYAGNTKYRDFADRLPQPSLPRHRSVPLAFLYSPWQFKTKRRLCMQKYRIVTRLDSLRRCSTFQRPSR